MDRLAAACEKRRSHRVDDEPPGSGWVICADCGVPLSRPDGGPVALTDGGRLGLDPRESPERERGSRRPAGWRQLTFDSRSCAHRPMPPRWVSAAPTEESTVTTLTKA